MIDGDKKINGCLRLKISTEPNNLQLRATNFKI